MLKLGKNGLLKTKMSTFKPKEVEPLMVSLHHYVHLRACLCGVHIFVRLAGVVCCWIQEGDGLLTLLVDAENEPSISQCMSSLATLPRPCAPFHKNYICAK